jgi:hypothetical protein
MTEFFTVLIEFGFRSLAPEFDYDIVACSPIGEGQGAIDHLWDDDPPGQVDRRRARGQAGLID